MLTGALEDGVPTKTFNVAHYKLHGMKEDIVLLKAHGLNVKEDVVPWCLIDPRPGRPAAARLAVWDSFAMFALIFTALVSPFEVSFLDGGEQDGLWWLNRLVDLIFITDTCLQFFLMYQDEHGVWVNDFGKVVRHYLATWFTIDLVSTLVAGLDIVLPLLQGDDSDGSSRLELLRMFRILRLIKLARLLRASKVLQRWQTKLKLDYATLTVTRCITLTCIVMHWSACLWALQVAFASYPLSHTWMGDDGYCVPEVLHTGDTDNPRWEEYQRFQDFTIGQDLSTWVPGTSTLSDDMEPYLCVHAGKMYTAALYCKASHATAAFPPLPTPPQPHPPPAAVVCLPRVCHDNHFDRLW